MHTFICGCKLSAAFDSSFKPHSALCMVCQELERPKTKKRETPPKTPKAKGNKPTTNEKKTMQRTWAALSTEGTRATKKPACKIRVVRAEGIFRWPVFSYCAVKVFFYLLKSEYWYP